VDERIREQLVGYALGALDDTEQSEIEQRLSVDPELRRALESVQQSLEPLVESYDEYEAPPGLASTACAYVAEEAARLDSVQPGLSRAHGALDARSRWAPADWVVMGGICAAALCLFFPAILNSRFLSRVTVCQDNLRQLGTSLVQYSEYAGNGCFPGVPTAGNHSFAGFYGPMLIEAGLLRNHRIVICPDSALADNAHCFRIPTISEIDAARGQQILILQQLAGGSYGYTLGYVLNGKHMPVKNLGRSHFAIMADAPRSSWAQFPHQHGQNILYEDMHISFVSNGPNGRLVDDPFCNRLGRCEAGLDMNDAVVAPSDFPPIRTAEILSGN
jgi:hypothetical protein